MPRKGPAYPITEEWQGWVRDRMEELGIKQAELSRRAGVSKTSVTDMLADDAVQTTVMPQIHRALEWPPPLLTPPVHVLRLVEFFSQLSELAQGQWLERFRQEVDDERERRARRKS